MTFKEFVEHKWMLWDGGAENYNREQIEMLLKWREKSYPDYEFRIIPSIWGYEGYFALEGKKKN
jgi:hypothetical protein